MQSMPVLQGVRIDYVLLSPGLLQRVVSCEVISSLPPKWSDHAALLLELRDVLPAQPHPPCALSSARMKRFAKPKASIASMFAKRRADDGAAVSAPAAKRARSDPAAAEVDAAAVSATSSQGVPEKPDVSETAIGEGQAPVNLEGSKHLASASMQLKHEEQAGRSEAGEVSQEGKQKQADVDHVSQTGTTHLAAGNAHDGNTGEVMPEAAKLRDPHERQAATPRKGKVGRTKRNSKAGEVPVSSSPRQKSIRGFFTSQS